MKTARLFYLSLLVGCATVSQADVLVNTFGGTGLGYFPSVGWDISAGQWLGKTFTTGTTYSLTGISFAMRLNDDTDQVMINLRSDVGGQPDSILESFTITNSFGAGVTGVYNLNSVLSPVMNAGTYHVTLEALGAATGKWNLNNGAGQGLMVVSTDSGSSWTSFTDTNGAITVTGAKVVPEPATMAALGLGILAMVRRRKKA